MIKKIQILGFTYKIKWVSDLVEKEKLYGDCNYDNKTIRLQIPNKNISKKEVLNTFYHEVFHAILKELGLDKMNNEHIVVLLSGTIQQILGFAEKDIMKKLFKDLR